MQNTVKSDFIQLSFQESDLSDRLSNQISVKNGDLTLMSALKKKFTVSKSLKEKTEKRQEQTDFKENFDVVFDGQKEGNLTLHMPEEFYNPNKKVTKIKIINIQDEVKIIEGEALKNFHASDIKGLIQRTDDVKKVVVEQITVADAKRMSLLYDKGDEVDDDMANAVNGKSLSKDNNLLFLDKKNTSNQSIKPQNSLLEFEFHLNSEFLEDSELHEEKKVYKSHGQISERKFSREKRAIEFDIPEDRVADNDSVVYRRKTLIRKAKKKKPHAYYYRAKNHKDLFKVGSAYYDDVKDGLKSFGFTNINSAQDQENTIFGIAAFFNYHTELDVTIVVDSIKDTSYLDYVKDPERKIRQVLGEDIDFEYYHVSGIDIIETQELKKVSAFLKHNTLEEVLDDLVSSADVVLWDMPSVSDKSRDKEVYFPVTMLLENVSIIAKLEDTKMNELEDMLDFYEKYNVAVKGIVLGQRSKKNKAVGNV